MKPKIPIKKIIFSLLVLVAVVGVFGFLNVVLAQDRFGLETAAEVGLPQSDLRVAIVNIIRWALGFLGLIAVIIIMYGGYLWLTAGGDAKKIDKAKRLLISAVIGLIIILSAFVIASFIIRSLQRALCEGENCVTVTCPNPPCTPTCATPPCTIYTANRYTYINELKDDSLSWSRALGSGFSGTANMPASATLQVGGYAKNRGGTINSMELFTAPLADTLAAQSAFVNVPTNQEIVSGVYAPWNSTGYQLSDEYKAKITAVFPGLS